MAGRQLFKTFPQLHIGEPGSNWYHSLWRVLEAYHNLPGQSGLSPHRILFLPDRGSRTLPWMTQDSVAREAKAMMLEAPDTAKKVCDAMVDGTFEEGRVFPIWESSQISAQGHRVGGAAPQRRLATKLRHRDTCRLTVLHATPWHGHHGPHHPFPDNNDPWPTAVRDCLNQCADEHLHYCRREQEPTNHPGGRDAFVHLFHTTSTRPGDTPTTKYHP